MMKKMEFAGNDYVVSDSGSAWKKNDRAQEKNPFYTAAPGLLDDVEKKIFQAEFEGMEISGFQAEIWLDINTNKIEKRRIRMSPTDGYSDGYDGKILLWTMKGKSTISDLRNLIVVTGEKPFGDLSFVKWYLINRFADRIEWN